MSSIPVLTEGVSREIDGMNSLSIELKSENENAEMVKAGKESSQAALPKVFSQLSGKKNIEKWSNIEEIKQSESLFLGSTLVRESSGDIDLAQTDINAGSVKPAGWEIKPSRSRESQSIITLYTAQAPLELISFFYRIGREAKERGSCSSLDYLPEDTLIPDRIPLQRSLVRTLSGSTSCDLRTPSISNSDHSKDKLKSVVHRQIFQRSLSWLGQSLSQVTSGRSSLLRGSGRSSWNPSSCAFDEDDLKMLADESAETKLKSVSPKIKNLSLSDRALTLDSVVEGNSDTIGSLSRLRIGRGHKSNISKRPKKSTLYPTGKRSRRCKSSDFAFSEANEISQVNLLSITSQKEAKNYLTNEEKEVCNPFMKMLISHLGNGSSKRIVSRGKRRRRQWRDAMRREKLSKVFGEKESDSLIVGALLRAATNNYEIISSVQTPVTGRKKYTVLLET